MARSLKDNGSEGNYRIRGHLIPSGGWKKRLAKGRAILAGDSAGFVDPFMGTGIAFAIRWGQVASAAVVETLSNDVLNLE